MLSALQRFQKPAAISTRRADRVRLCSVLPTLFALSPWKKDRETVQRILQASLLKALRQTSAEEPLLDFVAACFIHFLSRLEVFQTEAGASASAFPESTKISTFFCDALLQCEPTKKTELAAVVLRVCERVRYFVDRERPKSDAVHRAANALRYAMEKKCPELGVEAAILVQGAYRGSMPAELFALRQELMQGAQPPAIQSSAAVAGGEEATSALEGPPGVGGEMKALPAPCGDDAADSTPSRQDTAQVANAADASGLSSVARPCATPRGGGSTLSRGGSTQRGSGAGKRAARSAASAEAKRRRAST